MRINIYPRFISNLLAREKTSKKKKKTRMFFGEKSTSDTNTTQQSFKRGMSGLAIIREACGLESVVPLNIWLRLLGTAKQQEQSGVNLTSPKESKLH